MPANLRSGGLSEDEFQHLRLALSVFQDGSGWEQFKSANGTLTTYPGYRQFERVVADVFDGLAPQNKGIFDVLLPLPNSQKFFGISCKMKGELKQATGLLQRVYIEMSNAAGRFMDEVKSQVGLDFLQKPFETGCVLLAVVQNWYENASTYYHKAIELEESSHLILLYDKMQNYQLYQYPLSLPAPDNMVWSFRPNRNIGKESRALIAQANDRIVLEWYLSSGGQMKYYPPVEQAIWKSHLFQLEPIPAEISTSIVDRAATYFSDLW